MINLSKETSELFKAFSAFQGELDNASKGKQGHGYKYADLAECINTAKPFLAKHGLAVSQMLGSSSDGKQTLMTILTHASGQYMWTEFVMVEAVLAGNSGKNPAQTLGSAITYQRRYAYAAIIGLAQEDNDAAGLQRKEQHKQAAKQPPAKPAPSPDELLQRFTAKASQASADDLTKSYGWIVKSGIPQDYIKKAEEVYLIRKSELEGK
ncbi:essential recombination function protein [Vibrio phage 1.189.B._10N.286.51.B5]|nr:essential recombination function protein [Vibrio phage 1.189.B._10N.286.51.B5]AUR93927.1 essential recombination function protein [Vibrio phage 1.189.C._10N.286.51.B5]AUR93993.1 essential recombination function protein [Vibrio phage 1.189.O._10N.286.51.B5]